ncbi:MAG: hypothetical protein AB7L09_21625 [Nitrospira sp.]
MQKFLIVLALLLAPTMAYAADGSNDCRPYYIQNGKDGPGSLLADIFLLPGTLVVAGAAQSARVVNPQTADDALCAPIAIAKHARDKARDIVPTSKNN